jgi:hypothetical protein
MGNFFDQFDSSADTKQGSGNYFDQFDEQDPRQQDGALTRGWNKMVQRVGVTKALALHDNERAAELIAQAAQYERENPGTPQGAELMEAWRRGDGISGGIAAVAGEIAKDWREAPGVVAGIKATGKNLTAMGAGVVEQTPNMLPPMAGLLAGGAAGAASPVPGGTVGGAWLGASAGNALVEGGGLAQEALAKAGINPDDSEAVRSYLDQHGDTILKQAGIKGAVIGAVDTATMGIAGKLLAGPAKDAAGRALIDMGVDVADKAAVQAAIKSPELAARVAADPVYRASTTGAAGVARNATAAALEPTGEFAGEYLGQGLATGDYDTKEAFLEAASSIGQSGATFAGQKMYAAAKYPFRAESDVAMPSGVPVEEDVAAADVLGTPAALYAPANLTALDRVVAIDAELTGLREAAVDKPEELQGPLGDKIAELQGQRDAITASWPQATPGAETSFSTETGARLDGQYALMEAGDLTTSHDENLRPVPTYPAELQPRERERHASELQIQQIVQKIDPARLGESADVATGAPIVGADGLVESGNARTIALKRIYQANGQKAENYRQFLRDNADRFGIAAEDVDALQRPVLVRVRATPVNRAEFARQANAATVARMSPSEQARADAAMIDSLDDLNPDESGDFMSGNSRPFVRRFLAKLPATEQAGLIDAGGQLSQAGYSRIRNAVLARAYGNSPVLQRMVESLDDNVRNVGKALMRVAPQVAKTREAIGEGALHDADLTPDLLSAVEELSTLKEKGVSVEQALAQAGMFGDKLSPEGREFLGFLNENIRSPRRIADFVQSYLSALHAAGNPAQASMFGDAAAPAKGDLMAAARRATNGDAATATPGGADAGNAAGAQEGRGQSEDAAGREAGHRGDAVSEVDRAAHAAATSPLNDKPEPTEAQREAGNFAMGHARVGGLDVSIEHPDGSTRSGTDKSGKAWSREMKSHYGYIRRTAGADGEHVDAYVRPGTPEDYDGPVFVVDQKKADGSFDEHKAMIGWDTEDAARQAYLENYPKDWDGIAGVARFDVAGFRDWLRDGDMARPAAEGAARREAANDFRDALDDLGGIVRDFAAVARIVPEDTPGLMDTLVRLFDAAIRLGYHDAKKAVAYVKEQLRADERFKAVWNKISQATYLKAARQAADADLRRSENPIPVDETLTGVAADIQTRFRDWIWSNVDAAVQAYQAANGNVINTDEARKLSPDYNATPETRSLYSAAVHEGASWLVKEVYRRELAKPAPAGRENLVLFTAGGTGAGKSSAVKASLSAEAQRAQIVFDTNMNGLASSDLKIRQALDAGKRVVVAYVFRDPLDALVNGALPRAMNAKSESYGRSVPLREHVKTHVGANETIRALAEKYARDPNVLILAIDNTRGRGQQALVALDRLPHLSYNGIDLEAYHEAVRKEHEGSRISDAVLLGTLGRELEGQRRGQHQPGNLQLPRDARRPDAAAGGAAARIADQRGAGSVEAGPAGSRPDGGDVARDEGRNGRAGLLDQSGRVVQTEAPARQGGEPALASRAAEARDANIPLVRPFNNASGDYNPDLDPYWIKQAGREISGDGMSDAEYHTAVAEYANAWRLDGLLKQLGWRRRGSSNVSSSTYYTKDVGVGEYDEEYATYDEYKTYEIRVSDHEDRHQPSDADGIERRFQINFRDTSQPWADVDIGPNASTAEALDRLREIGPNDQSAPEGQGALEARGRAQQTETPEFKRWFGDSKVVDAEGRPLVMYHWTDEEFSEFRPSSLSGDLLFFSDDSKAAKKAARGKKIEMRVYVRMENPLNTPETAMPWWKAQAAGNGRLYGNALTDHPENDGLYIKDEGGISVAVRSPEQIKSINNRGTFDPKNPDIRLSRMDRSAVGRMQVDDVRAVVDGFRKAAENLPFVHVLQNTRDAPREVQRELRELDAMLDAAGFYSRNGEIYLFASHLTGVDHAQHVFLHEAQHYGLEGLFSRSLDEAMMYLYEHNGRVKIKADARMKADRTMSTVRAVEEVLADMAGAGTAKKLNGWDKVVAVVREWFRKAGWVKNVTDNDVAYLVYRAELYWRRAQKSGYSNVKRGRLSRVTDAPADQPLTTQQRAEAIVQQKAGTPRLIDTLARGATRALRVDRLTSAAYDKAAALLDRYTPEQVKAGLVSDYGIPEAVLDQRAITEGRQRKQLRAAGVLLDRLATLTRAESRVAYEWMNSDDPQSADYFREQLPPESVKTLAEVEKMIDDLSQEAVRLGQLDPEAFRRNRFAYLHRSYAKHTAELTKGEAKSRARAISILGDQYRGRGMTDAADMARIKNAAPEWWNRKLKAGQADKQLRGEKFVRLERRAHAGAGTEALPGVGDRGRGRLLEVAYWPAAEPLPARYAAWDHAGTWEVRDTRGSKLILWRDFTKQEREALGEIDEVRYAIAKTLHGMIHDVEVGKYLEWLAQRYAKKEGDAIDGEVVEASERMRDTFKPGEWFKVPDSVVSGTKVKKYGVLAGRYLPGPIWNDVRQMVGFRYAPLGETYAAIQKAWKTSKTALSPAVHMNNVMANFVMADWHDVTAGHILKALKLITSKDAAAAEVMARFADSGGTVGTWATKELQQDQLRPLLEALEKELGVAGAVAGQVGVMAALQLALRGRLPSAWEALKPSRPGQATVKAARALIDLYEAEDQVFRLAAWLKAKEDGLTDMAAGKAARRSFLDYSINAPWVQMLRSTAFPFIAFTYRAVPMLMETAAKKPWKLLKLGATAAAVNALGYLFSGGDEDDERKLLPEEKAGRIWGITPKLIRMPWNDQHGSPVFLDVRRWIPVGDVFDVGQSHAAVPLLPAMTPGGPLMVMAEMALNQAQFSGKGITLETDTPVEKAGKLADYLYKAFAPNLIVLPGSYAWTGAVNAGTGRTDSFGREQSLPQAIVASVGIKVGSYPKDVLQLNAQRAAQAKMMEIDRNISALRREYQRHGIDADEFREKAAAQMAKKREVVEDLQKRVGGR